MQSRTTGMNNNKSSLLIFVVFLASVKIGGTGRNGPKGGTSSLAVTDTCEDKKNHLC